MRHFCLFIACIFAIGTSAGLSAQAPAPQSVSVDFYVYLWPSYSGFMGKSHAAYDEYNVGEDLGNGRILPPNNYKLPLLYASGVDADGVLIDPEKMNLKLSRLTGLQTYRGAPTIHFYLPDRMGGEAESAPKSIGSVTLSPSVKKVIIVMIRTGESSYEMLPIAYPEVNDAGNINFAYNLTRNAIGCTMGGEQYKLEPFESVVLDSKIVDAYFEMILVAAKDSEGQWQRKLSRKYPKEQSKDTLFLVYNRDGNPDLLDLLRIKIRRQ